MDRQLPVGWEEDWLIVPIDDPEAGSLKPAVAMDGEGLPFAATNELWAPGIRPDWFPDWEIPSFGEGAPFPGAPHAHQGGALPPPDALVFYLPFHYFHPKWWGVYLVLEGVCWLARRLKGDSRGILDGHDAEDVARLFLYGLGVFHHSVEAFATRLEITHRVPLYREPFERYFRNVSGTTECIQEALASAHGYRKVKEKAFRKPKDPRKRGAALDALKRYIEASPPGYNRAMEFVDKGPFVTQRAWFAEDNHAFSLRTVPRREPAIWHSFPQAFTGISRITSRVNYLVRRDSPLATRSRL